MRFPTGPATEAVRYALLLALAAVPGVSALPAPMEHPEGVAFAFQAGDAFHWSDLPAEAWLHVFPRAPSARLDVPGLGPDGSGSVPGEQAWGAPAPAHGTVRVHAGDGALLMARDAFNGADSEERRSVAGRLGPGDCHAQLFRTPWTREARLHAEGGNVTFATISLALEVGTPRRGSLDWDVSTHYERAVFVQACNRDGMDTLTYEATVEPWSDPHRETPGPGSWAVLLVATLALLIRKRDRLG